MHAESVISLESHNCKNRRSIRVEFASEDQALAYCEARRSTHAVHELEDAPIAERFARLINYLHPTCPHGLSEWLCADPVSHYPA